MGGQHEISDLLEVRDRPLYVVLVVEAKSSEKKSSDIFRVLLEDGAGGLGSLHVPPQVGQAVPPGHLQPQTRPGQGQRLVQNLQSCAVLFGPAGREITGLVE